MTREYPQLSCEAILQPTRNAERMLANGVGRIRAFGWRGCVVPTAETVLSWATGVANEWRWLAFAWHIALAAFFVAVSRSRVSQRLLGFLLVLPIVSVAVLAWESANPFNASMFTVLAALLLRSATRRPRTAAAIASRGSVLAGMPLIAVGWLYPHFLVTDSWTAYAYASPFGLLPCPTLSVVVGLTLVFGGVRSAGWNGVVAGAGVLYGALGVFWLGVSLDVWLLVGAILLGALFVADLIVGRVRANDDERTRRLAGDELIPAAVGTLTHAITIGGSRAAVWPWIVQMGAGRRAGWYSYDFLDNGRQASAIRIVPDLQHVTVGTIFPALPGITEGFIVLAFEPGRFLILGWPNPDRSPMVTWTFVLEERPGDSTRLIVRVRAGEGYRFHGLPVWLSKPVVRVVHFAMQRKQLLGIKQRVESSNAVLADAA